MRNPQRSNLITALHRTGIRMVYGLALRWRIGRSLRFFFPLWRVSNAVYIGPAGPSATIFPELRALQLVSQSGRIGDAELYGHLTHRSALICGYCLEALILRGSPLLERLPDALLNRQEPVVMGVTCFRVETPLGKFALNRTAHQRFPFQNITPAPGGDRGL